MQKESEVREAILTAAREQFQQYGLTKTTMEDIARAAGKGKSTLYYYFKDRDSILEAVVDEEVHKLVGAIHAAVGEAGSFEEKFRAFMIARFRIIRQKTGIYHKAFLEILDMWNRQTLSRIRKRYRDEEIAELAALFTEGIRKGVITSIDKTKVTEFARVGIAALHGLETMIVENDGISNEVLEEHLSTMSAIFCKGLFNK